MTNDSPLSDDSSVPLIHRTDRIAFRNETQYPVVFADDNPLQVGSIRHDESDPTLRHQYYEMGTADLDEIETTIREVIDRFEVDTERQFYYTINGDQAQICGNTIDDFFDAISNFGTTYVDLKEQLADPAETESQTQQETSMKVTCVGVIKVDSVWLQFVIDTFEHWETDTSLYGATTLWVTTYKQQGPLTAQWLGDRLDHPVIGSPSSVSLQSPQAQLPLTVSGPLNNVKEHQLVGYGDEMADHEDHSIDIVEYISCQNPYYHAEGDALNELRQRVDDVNAPDDLLTVLLNIDRLPLRPRGGSHGIDTDRFVNAGCHYTSFVPGSGIVLASGEVDAILAD